MMNPVHARCNDDQIQNLLDPNRQTPVGMMKECRDLECDEEHDQHYWPDAKEHHRERKKANRENHFAEMESRSSTDVEIKIGVMHVMKSPEERNHMIRPMPPPVGIIHQQERRDTRGPSRQSKPVQQADMAVSCPHCRGDRDWQHSETDDGEARNREDKVAYQPVQHAEMLASQRKTPLQPEQREKYTG